MNSRSRAQDLPRTGVFSFLPSASIGELLARAGYGFVLIDMEHSPRDWDDIYHTVRAVKSAGAQAWIRVASLEPSHVQVVAEVAPDGVVAPFINDIETAMEFVRVSTYPPRGSRGFCSLGRVGNFGMDDPRPSSARRHDQSMARIATVEHVDALELVPDILHIDGIDGLLFGRADMAESLPRVGGEEKPGVLVDRAILDELKNPRWEPAVRGGVLGILAYDAEEAASWRARGIGWVIAGADTTLLVSAARAMLGPLSPTSEGGAADAVGFGP